MKTKTMPTSYGQQSPENAAASRTAVIVLGAGFGSRFGSEDKLGSALAGKPLSHHLLAAVAAFPWAGRILVHRKTSEWTEAYREAGFRLVRNDHAELGMLSSLKAGLAVVGNVPQALLCLADMPFVEKAHVARLLVEAGTGGIKAVATRSSAYRGPPAIIPTDRLATLPSYGEGGARSLLDEASCVDAEGDRCRDVDLPCDLSWAEGHLRQRTVTLKHSDLNAAFRGPRNGTDR